MVAVFFFRNALGLRDTWLAPARGRGDERRWRTVNTIGRVSKSRTKWRIRRARPRSKSRRKSEKKSYELDQRRRLRCLHHRQGPLQSLAATRFVTRIMILLLLLRLHFTRARRIVVTLSYSEKLHAHAIKAAAGGVTKRSRVRAVIVDGRRTVSHESPRRSIYENYCTTDTIPFSTNYYRF